MEHCKSCGKGIGLKERLWQAWPWLVVLAGVAAIITAPWQISAALFIFGCIISS